MATSADDHGWLYRQIGRRIFEARRRRRMTQIDLARAVSLTRTSITNIEKGRQRVMLHTLYDIARTLGTTPGELLPDDGGVGSFGPGDKIPADLGGRDRELIESAIRSRGKRKA